MKVAPAPPADPLAGRVSRPAGSGQFSRAAIGGLTAGDGRTVEALGDGVLRQAGDFFVGDDEVRQQEEEVSRGVLGQ